MPVFRCRTGSLEWRPAVGVSVAANKGAKIAASGPAQAPGRQHSCRHTHPQRQEKDGYADKNARGVAKVARFRTGDPTTRRSSGHLLTNNSRAIAMVSVATGTAAASSSTN